MGSVFCRDPVGTLEQIRMRSPFCNRASAVLHGSIAIFLASNWLLRFRRSAEKGVTIGVLRHLVTTKRHNISLKYGPAVPPI